MSAVYYFTRTGNCRKIAEGIAAQTAGTCREITDHKNWKGIGGYIKAGYYASMRRKVEVKYEKPAEGETVYLCFPIWAGTFPPAVRSFIEQVGRDRVVAIASSKASLLKDREGFLRVIDVPGEKTEIEV